MRTTPAFLLLASVAQTQLAALLCIDDRYLKSAAGRWCIKVMAQDTGSHRCSGSRVRDQWRQLM